MSSFGESILLNRDNVCCIIVTFNPDQKLEQLVVQLCQYKNNVLIVDNNSGPDKFKIIQSVKDTHEEIRVIVNDTNIGIAAGLNKGIDFGISHAYKGFVLFDQDSLPIGDIVNDILEVYNSAIGKYKVGVTGVNYTTNNQALIDTNSNQLFKEADTIITSGSFITTDVYNQAGRFRDDFFIDSVDFEYCLRLNKLGYTNVISNRVLMSHTIGNFKFKKILGISLKSSGHSVLRRFYMSRNNMLLTRLYFLSFPLWVIKKNLFFILSIFLFLLVDTDRQEKWRATLKGIREGLTFKL